jgi:UDP-N-acetylmuramoyl-L-alanine---L-glutamate ligase
MNQQANDKPKTLGIVGFGKEGQAIFHHYQNQFDQIYIFDEKLDELNSILEVLCQNSPLRMGGSEADGVVQSEAVKPPYRILDRIQNDNLLIKSSKGDAESASTNRPVIKSFNNLNIPPEVDFLVKSPGIATHKVFLSNPKIKIQSLISLLFEKLDMSKVVAVTGTKGKSTVSSLITHILKTAGQKVELLGNIGNININLLDNFDLETYYVFELSSFQCQQLTRSPHIAIWINFFIDHQDVHKSMEEYYQAKANICKFQSDSDFFITIPELEKVKTKAAKIIIENSILKSESNIGGEFTSNHFDTINKKSIDLIHFQTKLLGQHNQINCQFAFEACRLLNIGENHILDAIATFEPIKGRLEKVNEVIKNGKLIEFYTDDLATIPEATWQAFLAFEGRVQTLITGGYDKGSDYTELAKTLVDSKIQNIIYFNPTGQLIVSKLDPKKVNLVEAKSMGEAVELAFKLTDQGVCLLSCASASFGMFKNAYDRGQQYQQCIAQAKIRQI